MARRQGAHLDLARLAAPATGPGLLVGTTRWHALLVRLWFFSMSPTPGLGESGKVGVVLGRLALSAVCRMRWDGNMQPAVWNHAVGVSGLYDTVRLSQAAWCTPDALLSFPCSLRRETGTIEGQLPGTQCIGSLRR